MPALAERPLLCLETHPLGSVPTGEKGRFRRTAEICLSQIGECRGQPACQENPFETLFVCCWGQPVCQENPYFGHLGARGQPAGQENPIALQGDNLSSRPTPFPRPRGQNPISRENPNGFHKLQANRCFPHWTLIFFFSFLRSVQGC